MKRDAFGALSALFEYPLPEHEPLAQAFPAFAAFWRGTPLEQRRRRYVQTFDLRKDVCLHLTYPTFGDTRDRGVALARLKALYRAAGFEAAGNELPDFLPLVLDFCSRASSDQATHVLSELRTGIEILHRALSSSASPYAELTGTLRSLLPKTARSQSQAVRDYAENGAPMEFVGR